MVDFNYGGNGQIGKAREFYSRAFGWDVVFEDPDHYIVLQSANGTKLGLQQLAEGTEYMSGGAEHYEIGKPVMLIGTDDIDGTLARLKSLGARILLDKDVVPGIGFWAIIEDPCGTRFAVQQVTAQQG
jgi:predicted enzyme related to lactoylglutathione lyase